MDLLTALLATGLGLIVGLVAGLVPGLHVNTVCAVALAALPVVGPAAAIGLAAMAVAHGFSSILPSTYLGAPGEDTLLAALPAHRMLLDGKGPDAVQVSVDGALAGLAVSVLLLLPYKWLLGEPGRLLEALDAGMVWVLGGILVFLVLREVRGGAKAVGAAVLLIAVSTALGLLAGRVPVAALFAVPASSLLPLLSGLFGAPALLETLRSRPTVPDQAAASAQPPGIRRRSRRGVLAGVLAAAATSVLPGMTSSVAAAVSRAGQPRDDDPRSVLATLSAIALAQVVLGLAVLWLSLRARSGLAVAVQMAWPTQVWSLGAPPLPLQWLLLAIVASGVAAHVATARLDGWAARWLPRCPPTWLAGSALVLLVVVVAVLSGWMGLALFVTATAVGLLPLSVGGGRIHLTGCLLGPVLLYRLGWL